MSFRERYKRLEELSRGAFGVCYLVQERESKAKFAAKEFQFSQNSSTDEEAAKREAELLKSLSHENIVGYVDSMLDGSRFYIVMEFAGGGNLAERIRKAKEAEETFRESGIMNTFTQLALALQYIHGRRILHRNIKPMSIFLTKQGAVKLGSFGIAFVLEGSAVETLESIGDFGLEKTQLRTPSYISPEVFKREPYGIASDLWALGVVTYELAALKPPFDAECSTAVAMAICESEPPSIPDAYSRDLEKIVFGFLQKEPQNRPPINDVLKELSNREKDPRIVKDRLEQLERARLDALEDRRVAKERMELLRAGVYPRSAKDQLEQLDRVKLQALEDRRLTKERMECMRAGEDPRPAKDQLEQLERARLMALEDRRVAKERMEHLRIIGKRTGGYSAVDEPQTADFADQE